MLSQSSTDVRGILGAEHKSIPPTLWGHRFEELIDTPLSNLLTPRLTIDRGALAHNIAVFHEWTDRVGVKLAPHGKTTMAPALWKRQLDAGAWGITVATAWQAMVAETANVPTIVIANEVVDAVSLKWAASSTSRVICWVDSIAGVASMSDALPLTARPIEVAVELGGFNGRTGVRSLDEFRAVARAAADSPALRLVGAAGYEGALGHDRHPNTLARIEKFLNDLASATRSLEGIVETDSPIVSAGGSAYIDIVVGSLGPLAQRGWTVVVRSGAYLVHDDGFYRENGPIGREFSRIGDNSPVLRAALHVWSRVISRPEPGLVLLDAGKRDLPVDDGLPEPQRVVGRSPAESRVILEGAYVKAVNDQHTFLCVKPDSTLEVGQVVRLGISHPCTAFDKWRLIPEIDSADADDPKLVGFVSTSF